MAVNPKTAQIIAQAAIEVATDEEKRKKILIVILAPVILTITILAGLQYLIENPVEALASSFQGEDEQLATEFKGEYGYAYSYDEVDFQIGDYANVDATDPEQFQKLLAEGSNYIGREYVWGGSNPSEGFDCSGFICWIYTASGTYNLSRTTAQGIYNQCTGLPREQAKAGDLVFFTKTYNSVGAVSHIGLYLGDGKMLHCGNRATCSLTNTILQG